MAEAEKRGMNFAVVAYAGGVYRWARIPRYVPCLLCLLFSLPHEQENGLRDEASHVAMELAFTHPRASCYLTREDLGVLFSVLLRSLSVQRGGGSRRRKRRLRENIFGERLAQKFFRRKGYIASRICSPTETYSCVVATI